VHKSLWRGASESVKAVDGISFKIYKGHTLGLVGESGCGKTTTGRAILKLVEPTAGEIRFDRDYLQHLPPEAMLPYRKRMQIIFQDPYASLNARLTLEQTITEPMHVHGLAHSHAERRDRAVALLEEVGLEAAFLRR
jgi:peptide/nickel transport system ATP-binding protein